MREEYLIFLGMAIGFLFGVFVAMYLLRPRETIRIPQILQIKRDKEGFIQEVVYLNG